MNFKSMKYGMFIHYIAGAAYRPDGTVPSSVDEQVNGFDAVGFANDLVSFGVEYIIFTAWHFNMVCLYPSKKMNAWIPGHCVQRDLIGEMITAVRAKGIRVLLYTHPRDGHDFNEADAIATGWGHDRAAFKPNPNPSSFDFKKWNDFINDIYEEFVQKYGAVIDGIYLDEGSEAGDSEWVVDYPRLRDTIKNLNPDLIMIQNYYGNIYTCDIGDKEYCHYDEFASVDGDTWPCFAMPVAPVFSSSWSAIKAAGTNQVAYSAESMFRYSVLQAASNTDGGGVEWATGPYVGGGWETGVKETLLAIQNYMVPVEKSIKQTFPSTSYVTAPGTAIQSLQWGVATKSMDDKYEYLHVLKAPLCKVLTLPTPADGKIFGVASLLTNGHPLALTQTGEKVTLELQDCDTWDSIDTVIQLNVL